MKLRSDKIEGSAPALREQPGACPPRLERDEMPKRTRPPVPLLDRFWSYAYVPAGDGCWLWTSTLNEKGYGRIFVRGQDGRHTAQFAHRVAYELFIGPIPDEYEIDHLCHNRGCVNPLHLDAVTHAENQQRRRFAPKTHCPHGHELTPANVYLRVRGAGRMATRMCRICLRAKEARRTPRRRRGTDSLDDSCQSIRSRHGIDAKCELEHGHDGACSFSERVTA